MPARSLAFLPLLAMIATLSDRLSERKLGSVAVISLPRSIKNEMYAGARSEEGMRLTFTFATSYFWASFGSGTAYKQQIFVSVMAADASGAAYEAMPYRFSLRYDRLRTVRSTSLGSGTLTVREGTYQQNTLEAPSHLYLYRDRARRLQIVWHAVTKEMPLERGIDLVGRMAASFRIVNEPVAEFAEARDRPRREAELRTSRHERAREMLAREGFPGLKAGEPVQQDGIWVEWMDEPEPRFQLLKELGRVKATPGVLGGSRPRPASLRNADGTVRALEGSVGWWEHWDGEWRFLNDDSAYLPFRGIAARLSSEHRDPAWVAFYYSATVRVEEESADARLGDLAWFRRGLPEVERLWREGALVRGEMDEAPFPLRRGVRPP